MQRPFSNRGEALAENAAAKMRAGRRPRAQSILVTQAGKRGKPVQWHPQVEAATRALELLKGTKPKTTRKPDAGQL